MTTRVADYTFDSKVWMAVLSDRRLKAVSEWASIEGWERGRTAGLQTLVNCESALQDGWKFAKC